MREENLLLAIQPISKKKKWFKEYINGADFFSIAISSQQKLIAMIM